MTLKFIRVRVVVTVHVHAKLHQAACSGWWVIVSTEKKRWEKQYSPSPLYQRRPKHHTRINRVDYWNFVL